MPTASLRDITMHYETEGSGDPLILIPYLAADHACYAFQTPSYSKEYSCVAVDLRGAGQSDKPAGPYSIEQYADDVAELMASLGIDRAHVAGMSLGAATGMWLAAKYPERVASLSLHSAWAKTDAFIAAVVKGWQSLARNLDTVADMVIQGIFPWCFTPEMYAAKPDFVAGLEDFVRGRPAQPVDAVLAQTEAVLAHDATAQLGRIVAPTQITVGRWDLITSTRFTSELTDGIKGAEHVVFEHLSHAGMHEDAEEFNRVTLEFLTQQKL
ncbi:MAG: alpha/beta fold hydrolase [Acidimicrobiia bacterium]